MSEPTLHEYDQAREAARAKVATQAQAVGFLNQAQYLMTGFRLRHDQELIDRLFDPIYELLDRD